ncbi:protein tyrosine phosphatase receptor type Fa [Micropterus dolomieu]|uniref:protein tyrosine phosphatase receptor type Fa n=1 Tax=Micropterus dolomieu TaxID=147949 RepID=UPI001E8D022A|nr:protein tyrosine phosphatase receptor type Fa [Micropterus dolomieu]
MDLRFRRLLPLTRAALHLLLLARLVLPSHSESMPNFIKSPDDQTGISGGVASFVCQAVGEPKPRITWMKKGKKVSSQRFEVIEFDDGSGSVLRIQPLRTHRDEAIYECTATNSVGEINTSAKLTVLEEDQIPHGFPTIDMGPQLKVVERTRTATMLCAASGNPDPEIYWFKDFLPVDISSSNGRIKQLRSGALQIENSEESDQGKYECVAVNSAGTRYSAPANLYVRVRRVPPRFSIPPTNHEVMPGGSVNLTCVAVGAPMPYVKWISGEVELTREEEMPIGRNVLELTNIRQSTNYTCVAISSLGMIETTAQITVKALPKQPTSLIVTETTATSVTLTWDSGNPEPVSYYVIQYRSKLSDNGFQEVDGVATTRYSIGGLSPFSEYDFRVMAVNNVGRGPPSSNVDTRTSEQAPSSPPLHVQARMLSSSTMLVQWEPPEEPNGQIQGYRVYYSSKHDAPLSAWQKHNTDDSQLTTISGLTPDITYSLRVLGFTSVGDGPPSDVLQIKTQQGGENALAQRMFAASPFSEPITVKLHNGMTRQTEDPEMLWVMGPVLAVILIIIIVIAILLFKSKQERKRTSPAKDEHMAGVKDSLLAHSSDPVEMRRLNYQTQGSSALSCPNTPRMREHPPIAICDLADHIERLKANDGLRFSQEYESIDPGQQFTWEHSNLEVNKPKNRYANVIAYDHSRVILTPVDGVPGSDYINANYIDGYRKQNAYIATQGPLPETLSDFWRMVWEQRTCTIVMMTRLEEKSRVKCDQYWPSRGTETYGMIQVTMLDTVELATYTVRTFALYKNGSSEKREVRQFQFMAWPDHGVPEYPTPTLAFLRRVKACNPPDAGPMVVHCSAGVGRTGCFIVIEAMLERMKHEKSVDIYGHVTCMRAQRNYMVQTEDQYVFIHEALLEAATCGNTEVPARNLYAHIQKLTQIPSGETVSAMELEFKKLANSKAHTSRFISANLPCNKFKNRLVNILPFESTRVCLQPIRGVEGSDYINASFIDGYRQQKAYMATQGPLAETTEDFWRMLWEHNSTIVVMLTKLREMGREKCHQYWPAERSARYQYFVVDPMAEYNMPQYILREFKVTDARDGQSRTIRQFQFTDWPEQGVPKTGEGFIDFIGQVHKTKEQFGQDGPITVHCSAGVGRAGVFITLSIVLERMRYEGVVDLFQTVKTLRTQRPAMVQTEDQYQLCYRAALEYLGSFDHYAT